MKLLDIWHKECTVSRAKQRNWHFKHRHSSQRSLISYLKHMASLINMIELHTMLLNVSSLPLTTYPTISLFRSILLPLIISRKLQSNLAELKTKYSASNLYIAFILVQDRTVPLKKIWKCNLHSSKLVKRINK